MSLELRASVSLASRVFMDAVTTGKPVDDVYSIIQFRKDSLKLEAELNSTTHSVLANAHIANEFSERSSNISGLVNAGVPELLAKVNDLTERMQLINRTAEEAASNKSKAFDNGKLGYFFPSLFSFLLFGGWSVFAVVSASRC